MSRPSYETCYRVSVKDFGDHVVWAYTRLEAVLTILGDLGQRYADTAFHVTEVNDCG